MIKPAAYQTYQRFLLAFLIAFGFTLVSTDAFALHAGVGGLACGGCHTMHSSQAASSTNFGGVSGALRLLKATSVVGFCLQCHASNGVSGDVLHGPSNAKAPKVYIQGANGDGVGFGTGNFALIGAGGDFSRVGSYTDTASVWTLLAPDDSTAPGYSRGYGHSLGATGVVPPGNSTDGSIGATTITEFLCTSCHDPHGVSNTDTANPGVNRFRNLKAGANMPITQMVNSWSNMNAFTDIAGSYVGGVANTQLGGTSDQARTNVWPVYQTAASQNTYYNKSIDVNLGGVNRPSANADNVTHVGISAWCAQCHGAWHEEVAVGNATGLDWSRHPVNNRLIDASTTSGSGVSIVDFSHYTRTYGNLTVGYKLPVSNVTGTTVYYGIVDSAKVFCLSCHFAHAGPNFDALRWSYTSSVSAGNQAGNSVDSDDGCQQCHNRAGSWGL